MWGRILAFIHEYLPRDLVELSIFMMCFGFMFVAVIMQLECVWYIHAYPLTPIEGRCGTPARKDMLEALTTLVTLLIAFISGKRNGQNSKYTYKDDDDEGEK